jgi:hypothetical protein
MSQEVVSDREASAMYRDDRRRTPRGESGWRRAEEPAQTGWQHRGGKAGRLVIALDRMFVKHEALSMVLAPRGETRVVGAFRGEPRRGVWIESGRDVLFLDDRDIDWVDESDDSVIARGSFEGGEIVWRPYVKRMTRGREAAKRCSGDAGWLCEAIERLIAGVEEGECVGVELDQPGEGPYKLQWHEYDEGNGEIVLMVGRLDRLRQVRLRSDKLGAAKVLSDEIEAESFRGRIVTLSIMEYRYLVAHG